MEPLAQNSMVQRRYLIVQMIGSGSMGEVYLAVDQWSGSAVALKRSVLHQDHTLAERLEREAAELTKLQHPVLPNVLDHFVENGAHFLVLEQISGDDLAKRLEDAGKAFPLNWTMFWADQLLDALSYLHSHQPPIIHNDIKPKNLKLTDENHIVLLDFGLSKHGGKPKDGSAETANFASPEQTGGTVPNAASDIYAFSATFYQLMTNVLPPGAATRRAALSIGSADPVRPLTLANPEIPEDVSNIILKGLELNPERRFDAAVKMQKALRRAFKHRQSGTGAKTELLSRDLEATIAMGTQPANITQGIISTPDELSELETKTQMGSLGSRQDDIKTEVFSRSRMEYLWERDVATEGSINGGESVHKDVPNTAERVSPHVKRSSSKAAWIIAGIIGSILIAGSAGGIGWFVFLRYSRAAKVAAIPTPTVAVSPTPVAVMADVNANGNANAAQAATSNSPDANANPAAATVQTPATAAPTALPQVSTRSTPGRSTQPPPAKAVPRPATAAPKPKAGDDRTVILP